MLTRSPADFPNGIDPAQLRDEIRITVPTCEYIVQNGNAIDIYFTSLSGGDEALVDAAIAAHVPAIIVPISPFLRGDGIARHVIDGAEITYIGSQTNEIHISKETQGHFSSIKTAIAANPGDDKVFIVHPGDYVEDNPLNLASGTVITACGNAENTFITAANVDETVINLHVKCKLSGVCIRGGAVGVYFDQSLGGGFGKYSAMMECFVQDCLVGIDCDAKNIHLVGGMADGLYGREVVISSTVRTLDKGINVRRGGCLISAGMTAFGIPPIGPNPAIPILIGYNCEDPVSKLAMSITNCYFCGAALMLNSGCSSEMTLLTLKYNANGVVIGSGAGPTRFSVNSLEIVGSVASDIVVQNANASIEVHSGVFDDTKIANPAGARLNMRYHTNKNGRTRQRMLGIINVGTVADPAKMIIGEGSYDIMTSKFLLNDNLAVGTWTDITADAIEDSGAPFGLFAGMGIGNCLYIGRNVAPVGVKIGILTPASGTIVWEKWDGVGWEPFSTMARGSEEPFIYTTTPFATMGTYHIRFGLLTDDSMPPLSLNGIEKKWIRARVATTLSAIPTSEYILAHVSAAKIGGDGYIEYFGDARTVKKTSWQLADFTGTAAVAWLTKKINTPARVLAVNAPSSACLLVTPDIDCSFPIRLQMQLFNDTTETCDIVVRYDKASTLYDDETSAPTTGTEITTTYAVAMTAGVMTTYVCTLMIDHMDTHPLWLSIERTTGSGNVRLVQIGGFYMSWTDGAHSRTF